VYILFNFQLLQELKRNIEQYKPLKELNVDQARVLLVGQVGAGKSSFFNTINSIFRGYITSQACSGNAEHSLTTVVSNIHHYLYRAMLNMSLLTLPTICMHQNWATQILIKV